MVSKDGIDNFLSKLETIEESLLLRFGNDDDPEKIRLKIERKRSLQEFMDSMKQRESNSRETEVILDEQSMPEMISEEDSSANAEIELKSVEKQVITTTQSTESTLNKDLIGQNQVITRQETLNNQVSLSHVEPSLRFLNKSLVGGEEFYSGFGFDELFDPQEESFHVSHVANRVEWCQSLTDATKICAHQVFVKMSLRGNILKQLSSKEETSCATVFCGDEKIYMKHKWRSKFLQLNSELEFGVASLVLISSYARSWDSFKIGWFSTITSASSDREHYDMPKGKEQLLLRNRELFLDWLLGLMLLLTETDAALSEEVNNRELLSVLPDLLLLQSNFSETWVHDFIQQSSVRGNMCLPTWTLLMLLNVDKRVYFSVWYCWRHKQLQNNRLKRGQSQAGFVLLGLFIVLSTKLQFQFKSTLPIANTKDVVTRDGLLIKLNDLRLQVQVQQRHKKRMSSKTWMFMYKREQNRWSG